MLEAMGLELGKTERALEELRAKGVDALTDVPVSVSRPLKYTHMGMYDGDMARAATTADAFNAVAEPRRRQILDLLRGGEQPVGELVRRLELGQPQVSKHLRVLREVGAVEVREEGRQRLYRVNGEALRPIHDWVVVVRASLGGQVRGARRRAEGVDRDGRRGR